MFDVVPPALPPSRSVGRAERRSRRRPAARSLRTTSTGRGQSIAAKPAGPPVVQLAWQLPARLRRPVRQELARERKRQRQRNAIVRFERRSIYSQLPSGYPKYIAPKRTTERLPGAEQHTGDIYRTSKPGLSVPTPPYAGRFLQPAQPRSNSKPLRSASPRREQPLPSVLPTKQKRVAKQTPVSSLPKQSTGFPLEALTNKVRDVPYIWQSVKPTQGQGSPVTTAPQVGLVSQAQAKEAAEIRPPKRRFALPLHFSIFPLNLRPRKEIKDSAPSSQLKKKLSGPTIFNLALLSLGCATAAGLVWTLQGAGRGFAVLGSVSARAEQAYSHLQLAKHALAETDFNTSEQEFVQAEQLLRDARGELNNALAASQIVLQYLDVSGKVRSGENLLTAGEELTVAGQHVSRGIAPLLEVSVLPDTTEQETMVDALSTTFHEFTQANAALAAADIALKNVDSTALPDNVADQVVVLQETVPRANRALTAFLDQADTMMSILGANYGRQYLIAFENNHEIRPTGGFIGSIALLNVDRGTVESIDVKSVYDPDGQLKELIAPPNPLLQITNRWFMRDANWFVDFSTSAQKIAEFFEKEGGPTVDGVIAMTPEVIKQLLIITGPIEVPGYDTIVTSDNFVLLTQDQVTYSYDKSINKPKQFLADLTPLLLNKIFSAKADDSLRVIGAMGAMMQQKQLLIYFRDEAIQRKLTKAGWNGAFPVAAQGFLHVNNANIGGHKSDQFIEQEIDYRSEVKDNSDVEVVVTIRRTHRGPEEAIDYDYPAGEDPASKDNVVYQRVFVPQGAQLVETQGYTEASQVPRTVILDPALTLIPDPDVIEWQRLQTTHANGTTIGQEAGYNYFANWMVTKPGATTVGLYRYILPGHASAPNMLVPAKSYTTYIAKQAGDTRTQVRSEITFPEQFRIEHTVPNDGITQTNSRTLVYRGALQRDALIGAVYAKP